MEWWLLFGNSLSESSPCCSNVLPTLMSFSHVMFCSLTFRDKAVQTNDSTLVKLLCSKMLIFCFGARPTSTQLEHTTPTLVRVPGRRLDPLLRRAVLKNVCLDSFVFFCSCSFDALYPTMLSHHVLQNLHKASSRGQAIQFEASGILEDRDPRPLGGRRSPKQCTQKAITAH